MRRYAALPDVARARADRLRDELERIAREFPSAPASRYPPRVVAGYALREGVPLLLGLPLAFLGMVVHGLAYGLVAGLVRVLRPDVDTEATYKITAALVLFPTVWALEVWVTWRLAGPVPLVIFLVALVPLGFFALTWSERLRRARRDTSAYLRFLADRDLPRRLEERHRWIRSELHALAAEAPGDAP
jgi:hypothetical protein